MSSANCGRWGALAAMLGGALWALFPFGTPIANIEEPGTLAYPASVAYYWLMAVIPLLLLLVGLVGLYGGQRGTYGRLGKVGFPVTILALGLMFAGNAVEVASLTFFSSKSSVGHFTFLIGFLVLLVGSVLVGLAIWRARQDPPSRSGSLLLIGALPLGHLLGVAIVVACEQLPNQVVNLSVEPLSLLLSCFVDALQEVVRPRPRVAAARPAHHAPPFRRSILVFITP